MAIALSFGITLRPAARPSGQALLALVFLIGGIILAAGIVLALIILSFVDTSYGFKASQTAEAAAVAGAEDALLQIARNNTFASTGYSLVSGGTTATVVATQNSPSSGYITVLSTATVGNRTRKVNVVLSTNSVTGQASVVSWNEIQ